MLMKSRSIILLIAAAALSMFQSRASGVIVYGNDFSGSVGPEWSSKIVGVTPIGARRFLGEFSNDTVIAPPFRANVVLDKRRSKFNFTQVAL